MIVCMMISVSITPEHKIVAADSAYKTPWICKRIFESGRVLTSAYTRPKTKDGNHPLVHLCL